MSRTACRQVPAKLLDTDKGTPVQSSNNGFVGSAFNKIQAFRAQVPTVDRPPWTRTQWDSSRIGVENDASPFSVSVQQLDDVRLVQFASEAERLGQVKVCI